MPACHPLWEGVVLAHAWRDTGNKVLLLAWDESRSLHLNSRVLGILWGTVAWCLPRFPTLEQGSLYQWCHLEWLIPEWWWQVVLQGLSWDHQPHCEGVQSHGKSHTPTRNAPQKMQVAIGATRRDITVWAHVVGTRENSLWALTTAPEDPWTVLGKVFAQCAGAVPSWASCKNGALHVWSFLPLKSWVPSVFAYCFLLSDSLFSLLEDKLRIKLQLLWESGDDR